MQKFDGIAEKLKRAKENIRNLDSEVSRFFKESDYPVIPQGDHKLTLKAIKYHKNLPIPPRFSVLSGEVIHHLRSCFDHVAWHFSTGSVDNPRQVEFPVFEKALNHDARKSFKRKIEGIQDPRVISLIEDLQPYKAADPIDDPLFIIHDLDIVDKHRSLVILPGAASAVFPEDMRSIIESYERAHPELDNSKIARHFKRDLEVIPCIAFRNFGRREVQAVREGLSQLFDYTVITIKKFEAF